MDYSSRLRSNVFKNKHKYLSLILCLSLLISNSASFAATPVNAMFYNDSLPDSTQQQNNFATVFKPFRTFNKNTSIESSTNLTVHQQNISYKTNADFTTKYTLNKQLDNQFLFNVSVTQLNTKVETMGLQLQYNSQDSLQQDTTSNFAKPLFDIVGKNIQLCVDSTGTVQYADTSYTGEKIDNVLSGLSIAGEDFRRGNNFGLMLNKNPDNLQLGYTWTDSLETQDSKRVTKYSVQNRLHNNIILLVSGTVEQSGTFVSNGHSFQSSFSGSQFGKIIISLDTRLIKLRNVTYNLKGTVIFNGEGIPATATSHINETINPL